jgi:Domain of unknown function (DUF5122) beta-propeller
VETCARRVGRSLRRESGGRRIATASSDHGATAIRHLPPEDADGGSPTLPWVIGQFLPTAGLAGNDNAEGRGFALARYNPNGALDSSLGGDGKVATDFAKGYESAYAVAIQRNGRIVAVGQAAAPDTNFAIARYRSGERATH